MQIKNLSEKINNLILERVKEEYKIVLQQYEPSKIALKYDLVNNKITINIIDCEFNIIVADKVCNITTYLIILYNSHLLTVDEVLDTCPELLQEVDRCQVLKTHLKNGNLYDFISQEGWRFSKDELIEIIKEYDYLLYSNFKHTNYVDFCEEIAEELEERGFFE